MLKVERIYNALVKHNGKQVAKDSCRLEIDLSVLLELFALEDHIKEIEADNFNKECLIKAYEMKVDILQKELKNVLSSKSSKR